MVNESRENYIRAIYVISQRKGSVRGKDLAQYLSVSKNTVSAMLSRIRGEGYLSYKNYGALALTPKGKQLAKKLTQKHRLIELFLTNVLMRDPRKVHPEACLLEHDFSPQSMSAMKKLLGNPKADPHGSPINQ
ncbi:MAG TPA: metal-dependent transcriptional regulator [Candidatus Micrarchaeota archaeon]|nr:metal-dependent transcriptional regulator [Candidatus Micrarchaeota archaeon]